MTATSAGTLGLVAMPWRSLWRPDHRTPTLRAFLDAAGHPAVDHHLYLDVAQALGVERYERVYRSLWYQPLYQDACYAALLYPERRPQICDLLLDALLPEPVGGLLDAWQAAHEAVFAKIDWTAYDTVVIIGNGVVSWSDFHFLAGIYAARRIKAAAPATRVGLAGPEVSGRVGPSVLQAMPWVDFVVNGELEQAVLALAKHQTEVPGVLVRHDDGSVPLTRTLQLPDLDVLPLPRFDRYLNHPLVRAHPDPMVVIEGARGCWWDRTDRDPNLSCQFCNINLAMGGYRAKSLPRLVEEIRTLALAHGVTHLTLTDTVSRPKDVTAFFEAIAALGLDLTLHGMEAHVSMPLDAYPAMARAGVVSLQLGVEALVPSLLTRMNKGITAARIIAALRTCAELGLPVEANLLTWYPGSTQAEVDETMRRVPLLLGYRPLNPSIVALGEGSPLVMAGPTNLANAAAYGAMLPPESMDRLHVMIREVTDTGTADWSPVHQFLDRWKQAVASDPAVIYHRCADSAEGLVVERRAGPGRTFRMVLTGPAREVLLHCREPRKTEALGDGLAHLSASDVTLYTGELVRLGALAHLDGWFVSLPVLMAHLPPPLAATTIDRSQGAPPDAMPDTSLQAPLDAEVRTITGEAVQLSRYAGHVVLIVNTASRCRFTPQYEALERLHREFYDQGLRVLAFPSNDFALQEPGTVEQIQEFCSVRYGLTVDLFDKLHVLGPQQHPLYDCLTSGRAHPGMVGPVPWNFTKYVLDRQGRLAARFLPDVAPDAAEVRRTIALLLKRP